ncbi:uncharacterized protein si:ch211-14c7.2 isoform X2 [Syngnathoides biaculeatus]|uniref:uncharacterized protein si:ch211-14c7.2 isoform X2 n=1 Tax=Syngnathoides biaculeatus TaxID=300417 RepID=UPI002ADD5206|nr:uncharacterized protein si:ch211-14c7.2 isoform X2 [Syngnathoides biaculeatus]
MRLTWSAMLQHNNNNNYPCLKAAHRRAPLECPSASRVLPSRPELSLGDLPLIRGLRAWALCTKNRQKGDGRAPVTPPASRRTSCPRLADVHLTGPWGSGYGLPQAGAGALATVATLKTSEGNGKTQTQCLFLRNEKGSCSYATSGGTRRAGGWLRGKSGTSTERQDIVSALQTQTAASRVRVRRWRKSGHPLDREKGCPDEEVAEKQEEANLRCLANPEGKTCRKHGGPRGTPGRFQNSSTEESPRKTSHAASQHNNKSDEEVTVKHEELDKVCPDRLSSRKRDACKKSRGPGGSPVLHQIPSKEQSQRKSSHVADQSERLPEDKVSEKQEEADKGEQKRLASPDEGACQKSRGLGGSPRFLQNSSDGECLRKSSHVATPDKRLPSEEVPEKQEDLDKASSERLAIPKAVVCQESRGPRRRLGCLQNASDEDSPSREGTLSGIKLGWEQNPEKDEKGNKLCQSDPSISVGPNPDLECSHSHSEREDGKDSVNMKKKLDEEESTIQITFDNATTARSHQASHAPGGSTCQAEGEPYQVGRAPGNSGVEPEPKRDRELEHNETNTMRESFFSFSSRQTFNLESVEGKGAESVPNESVGGCALTSAGPRLHNPTPSPPPLGTMATSQTHAEAEGGEEEKGGQDGTALESRDGKNHEEEDDFGGFVQAEGGGECGQGGAVSDPLPCGTSAAPGSSEVSGESSDWRPTWTGSPDGWTAFGQNGRDRSRDATGRWWTHDDGLDRRLEGLFAAAFPSPPTSAPRLPADVIPTLTQLLESGGQEQRLPDGFGGVPPYKDGGGVARGLLLSSLQVERRNAVSGPFVLKMHSFNTDVGRFEADVSRSRRAPTAARPGRVLRAFPNRVQ